MLQPRIVRLLLLLKLPFLVLDYDFGPNLNYNTPK
jgi:hypothetical protein